MANPRQRRKARSSSHTPVKHSRRAKKILKKQPAIRGPKVLQDAWDRSKTVWQNYAALGLALDLNPASSGGVEVTASGARPGESRPEAVAVAGPDTVADAPTAGPGHRGLRKGFGRIVRDEAGNVVDVELAEEDTEETIDAAPTMEADEAGWNAVGRSSRWVRAPDGDAATNAVVRALEDSAAAAAAGGATPRHASRGEAAYLQRLVAAHGRDVDAMARDGRLNTAQKTAGELRRALRRAGA